ncbi:MAG: hypothetical protein WB475_09775 [Pseudolabrys sp.]
MKRRPAKRKAKIKMSQPYPAIEVVSASVGVWHGSIARLRVYSSTGMVQAFESPGTNDDLVGFTNDPNIIRALFLARDNGRPIWGYSDSGIEWLDY